MSQLSTQCQGHHRPPQPLIGGLLGVRYMQFKPTGEIYWKGHYLKTLPIPVDPTHYDMIQELGMHCQHLETIGVPVNARTAGSHANWFSGMTADEPYKSLLSRCPDVHVGSDKLLILFQRAAYEVIGSQGTCIRLPVRGSSEWQCFWSDKALENRGYTTWPMSYLEVEDLRLILRYYGVPPHVMVMMGAQLSPSKRRDHRSVQS